MLYRLKHLIAWLRRGRLDNELREEMQHHLELRRQQLVADGLDPRAATAAALRVFGSPMRYREEARDLWGFPSFDSLVQDLRFGARLLWRAPSVTAVAILSLAVGIGATGAVFSIADAALFRRLPVGAPHELHEFRATMSLGAGVKHLNSVPEDGLTAMTSVADFGQLAGFRTVERAVLGAGSEPQTVRVELVSANYFSVLGVRTGAGRLLSGDDARLLPVPIVLSERLWRTRFGADSDISGRAVTLNGVPATVVGVARGFRGVLAERPADVMVPAASGPLIDAAAPPAGLRVLVRLRSDVPTALAEERLARLYRDVAPDPLLRDADVRVQLTDASRGASDARQFLERPLAIGLALAAVLVLVACANAGSLLLGRFATRSAELGIRIAIGAGRRRLVRQLLVEAVLVGVLAAVAALLVASIAAPLLLALIPMGTQPLDFELRLDWRLGGLVAVLGTCAGIVAGAVPLARLFRSDTSGLLSAHTRTIVRGRRRATEVLIGLQVACSLSLLVAGAAMTRTLLKLAAVDPGFNPSGVVTITVDATGRALDEPSLRAYYAELHERLASAPQVLGVSSAQFGLMTAAATTGTIDIAGWSPATDDDRWVRLFWVGPDFFEVLGMPLVAGHSLGRHEEAGSERVAVVNRTFAEFYFGGVTEAVDRRVNHDVRIVGVTADAHYGTLREGPARAMFIPYAQAPTRQVRTFFLRTTGAPSSAIASALATIRAYDPALEASGRLLTDQIATTMSRERFVAVIAVVLAGLALLLACAGLYAAVAHSVAERRGELAIRLALGATANDVLRLVLRDPIRLTTVGLMFGVPGAFATMRALSALLYDGGPFEILTIATCGLILLPLAVIAALWPARHAARIDPQECLKIT